MIPYRFAWLFLLVAFSSLGASVLPKPTRVCLVGPLSPQEELRTFHIGSGFRVELVAAEPEVVDPVAMAFDEDGRLYVAEMRGYPNGGVGEGKPSQTGRIKLLEDRDGDGRYETSTVFLDNLRFPTGIAVSRGGVFVGDAPDLLYCRDTNGDSKADDRTVLFTGFGTKNIQQMLNSFQFHHDNWFHACNGNNESVVRAVGRAGRSFFPSPLLVLRGRHFRFRPDGVMQPTSGGGQYGLTVDDAGNWFTSTNSQHLRHIVLPDHYLARNPHLAVPAVTTDIPDGESEHGPAAKVYRLSPPETWRVERTTRRASSEDRKRVPSTELVPSGYMTSACSPLVYRGGTFPPGYQGNVFVCDPANNLIHRDILEPNGPTFRARRGEKDCEFLASTDVWFRPVFLCLGPDGAMYVADFYREVIETPLSLPDDIKKKYNLQSRERGRIWRIVRENAPQSPAVKMSKATNLELVEQFSSANAWRRLTAQRLLIERQPRQDKELVQKLEQLATATPQEASEAARFHALCTLDGLQQAPEVKQKALADSSPLIRKEAIRLLEQDLQRMFGPQNAQRTRQDSLQRVDLLSQLLALTKDPSPLIRFQLALSLGEVQFEPIVAQALMNLARKDGANIWHQTAILSSSLPYAALMLEEFLRTDDIPLSFLTRLAEIVAASAVDMVPLLLKLLKPEQQGLRLWVVLDGLGRGLERQGTPFDTLGARSPVLQGELSRALRHAREVARDPQVPLEDRQAALRIARYGPWQDLSAVLGELLSPQSPQQIQLAAVHAIAQRKELEAANLLLTRWSAFTPAVRREAQEALFARPERVHALLGALEKKQIPVEQIDLARRDLLRRYPHKAIRERATKLLATTGSTSRQQVVAVHRHVLQVPGDISRGRIAFRKHCATCHRLEDYGFTVGPELQSTLKTKTPEMLLLDILDPNREVDARFVNYALETKAGRLLTGILAAESAASVTLRRADGAEDTILRTEIETLRASGKSLMPEEFEKQLSLAELADLLAYLLDRGRYK